METINVHEMKPTDKDYPTLVMSLVPKAEQYTLFSINGLTVVPLVQVLDAIMAIKPDTVRKNGIEYCANCGAEIKVNENKSNLKEQTMDFLKDLYLNNKEEIDRVAKEYEQYKADVLLPQCMQMPLKTYEVWMEGYNCTGQSKQHEFIGAVKAESFEKACEIAVKQWCKSVADFDKYYDAKTQTFWGCKCYDNESDAAKGFG